MWSCPCLQRGCSSLGTQFKTAKLSHLNIIPSFGIQVIWLQKCQANSRDCFESWNEALDQIWSGSVQDALSFLGLPINNVALIYLRLDFTGIIDFLSDMVIEWAVLGVRDLFWVFSSSNCCIIFIYSPNKYWAHTVCWGLFCVLHRHWFITSESFPFEEPEIQT